MRDYSRCNGEQVLPLWGGAVPGAKMGCSRCYKGLFPVWGDSSWCDWRLTLFPALHKPPVTLKTRAHGFLCNGSAHYMYVPHWQKLEREVLFWSLFTTEVVLWDEWHIQCHWKDTTSCCWILILSFSFWCAQYHWFHYFGWFCMGDKYH